MIHAIWRDIVPMLDHVGEDEAVVALRDRAPELTIEGLREFCEGKLAHFKVPRYLRIVDEFPMTPNGKVNRRALAGG